MSSILTIIFWVWAGGISNRHYMTHREQDSWQSEADNQAAPKEIKPKTLSAHGLEMELEREFQISDIPI